MTDMLVAQRRERLLSELRASGGLKVVELATRLGVSRATVRRDLLDLESEGALSRVRGGAMLATPGPASTSSGPAGGSFARAERTLGLLVPSATYYYPRVVAGVQEVAAENDARVVISLTDYTRESDTQRIEELAASGASGLLVASPGGHDLPDKTLDELERTGLPFVLLERQPHDPFAACEFVATDHRQGAFAAVRHFARLGHRGVALFTNGSPTAALLRASTTRRLSTDWGWSAVHLSSTADDRRSARGRLPRNTTSSSRTAWRPGCVRRWCIPTTTPSS